MKRTIVFLSIVLLTISLSFCSTKQEQPQSPGEIAKAFFLTLSDGEFEIAESYMSPAMKSRLSQEQKAFFNTGQTKDVGFRKAQLNTLQKAIRENRAKILDALQQDLSKSAYEGYLTEVGIVLDEIRFIKKHLSKWAKARRVRTHLFQFPGSSYIYAEPYGVSLIISPWNYPFQLVISPLIGSMAAGNCSVVKPSEYAPSTARVFNQIISDNFEPNYIAVVEGEAPVSQALLAEAFDIYSLPAVSQLEKQSCRPQPGISHRLPWSWEAKAPVSWIVMLIWMLLPSEFAPVNLSMPARPVSRRITCWSIRKLKWNCWTG